MIDSLCETCGKTFSHYASQKRLYCSRDCVPKNLGNRSRWVGKEHVKFLCVICRSEFSVRPSRALRGDVKYCCYKCHQIGEGVKGGETRGNQMKAASQHKTYPKLKGRHLHRVIAEQKLGRPLVPGEIVHHDDENKQNNDPKNLIVLPNQAEHARLHIKRLRAKGRLK